MNKIFVVTKYIKANSLTEALRKDKIQKPDEIYLDNNIKNQYLSSLVEIKKDNLGFKDVKK